MLVDPMFTHPFFFFFWFLLGDLALKTIADAKCTCKWSNQLTQCQTVQEHAILKVSYMHPMTVMNYVEEAHQSRQFIMNS